MGLDDARYHVRYEIGPDQVDQLLEFYFDCWWTAGRTDAVARQVIAASHVTVVIESATEQVVGFARIVTDGAVYGYIADVMVRAPLRSTGLGRLLMEAVIAHPALDGVHFVELTCRPELDDFYARFDFREPHPSHVLRRAHGLTPVDGPDTEPRGRLTAP